MMTMRNRNDGKKIFLLVPALFAALLMGFMFLSCDGVGDEPDPATGPDSVYDPDFDEARPGIRVRLNPSTVSVPDPVTLSGANVVVRATYRDPDGAAVQGLQMNFTSDPPNANFTFFPTATFTDGNGIASVVLTVADGTLSGSYTIVAYTSPASAGPNAKGYAQLFVNYTPPPVTETVSDPLLDSATVTDTTVGPGVTAPYTIVPVGSVSSFGNPVTYNISCGNGQTASNAASLACNYTAAGTFTIRAQGESSTGVVSNWVEATVTVVDTP
jgi:hypothetical protein